MIQNNIPDSIVLDLFAGSGALGIEALSEGAKKAYLVDHNKIATQTIEKNIENLKVENAIILKKDYLEALKELKKEQIVLDIIFLDPPYKTGYIEKSIEKILEYNLLKESGIIVCESDALEKIKIPSGLKNVKEKKYGDKYIVILKKL